MTTDETALGRCPRCGDTIRRAREVPRFERSDGTVGVYAECPACATVVEPESG